VREKEEVDRRDDEHSYDDKPDVRAEGGFFLAGDSASGHDHEIESETNQLRHFFFSNNFLTKARAPRIPTLPMPAATIRSHADGEESDRELAKDESVAGIRDSVPDVISNAGLD
jgi:hypothetical protein